MSKRRRGPATRVAPVHRADPAGTFAVWLAVLALVVFLPDAFTRWFLPKELLLLVSLVFTSRATARGRMPRALWVLIGVGALVLAIAALASDNPVGALMGRWPRYEGLVALPVYVAAVWVGSRLLGPRASSVRIGSFTKALATAALLIGVVSALEGVGLRPIPGDADRPGSLLGNATDQGLIGAALALILLPALAASLSAAREQLGHSGAARVSGASRLDVVAGPAMLSLAVLASVLTIVISASRAGLLALGVGFVALMAMHIARRAREAGARVGWLVAGQGAGLAVAIAAVALAVPAMRDRLIGLNELAVSTVADRFAIWSTTTQLLAERPLLGVGPSGFVDAIAVRHDASWYRTVGPGTVLDSPHNVVLQAASAGGLLLLVVAALMGAAILIWGLRNLRAVWPAGQSIASTDAADARLNLLIGSAAALIGLGAGLLTHFTTASIAILIGLLIGICTAVTPKTEQRSCARLRSGLFVGWVVIFALITAADLPLAAGLQAKTAAAADNQFTVAQALRPWDGDVASIAAQALTERLDAGDNAAGPHAVRWAERAVTALPENLASQYTLGVALRAVGDVDRALDVFDRLHASHPAEPRVLMQWGATLIAAGNTEEGFAHIEAASALNPDDASISRMLAWARQVAEANG